ncbi:MAG TPA: histidine--tRNA ligase [Chitinispirillaceae bacterium]|jgi:histidyl-tRNA synthetase|nr:histidine--tRNA ligase [Chitinispirillaceae bacterium]
MSVPAGPKGTRDFYPEDMAFQQFIFGKWHKTCRRYGFEMCDAPMFEHLEIYTQKSGDEIEKQLYVFKDKAERLLALRPELTPSVARMVAAKGNNLKRPVRWYSIPRLFRYEKMQKGRLREFFQLNMDILGSPETEADAELIAASIDMMRDFGLTSNDFKVRISSRTLLEELFTIAGLDKNNFGSLYALLDRKSKIPDKEFQKQLTEIIPDSNTRNRIEDIFNAQSISQLEKSCGATPSMDNLYRLFELLGYYGLSDYALFDIGIVRGLAYYTGTVFELLDVKKNMRAIAGGGRYDKLVQLYGGPPTPAVGFAAGDVVLGELLKSCNLAPAQPPRSKVFLAAFEGTTTEEIISVASRIRSKGISCEFSFKATAISKQLKIANAARSIYTVFLGGEEGKAGKVRIKNMLSGNEETLNMESLYTELECRLGTGDQVLRCAE